MKKFVPIILFTLVLMLQADPVKFSKVDKEINYNLFAGDWEKSDSLIDIHLQNNPDNPKYYFMKAYNYFYARYFSNTAADRATTLRLVRYYTWKGIAAGEEIEQTTEVKFYMGCLYAYLGRVNIMSQEYWEGYWNATKSENYLEEALEEYPELVDAYLNLGAAEYFADVRVTGFQGFLAWIGGMSGDREMGLKYFKDVSINGTLFKDEATYILGLAYNFQENDPVTAYEYWTTLNEAYPLNNFFITQKERSFFSKLIDENGIDILVDEYDSLQTKYNINNANIINLLAYNLMNQGRMDDALIAFKVNLKLYPNVANCYDSIAECYMNREENEQAIKYYNLAYEKIDSDTTATEDFKEFLREGIEEKLIELKSRIDS